MREIDLTDYGKATEEIIIEDKKTFVHYVFHQYDLQEIATEVLELFNEHPELEHTLIGSSDSSFDLKKEESEFPELAYEVSKLQRVEFLEELFEITDFPDFFNFLFRPEYDVLLEPNIFSASLFSHNEPTKADIIGAFLTLWNAEYCKYQFKEAVEEYEEPNGLLSESYFDNQIARGMMLALRDAHIVGGNQHPLNPIVFRERDEAVRDAVNNVFQIYLTDCELAGLLLTRDNKSVLLQSASEFGKKNQVDAFVDIAKQITSEE